MTDWRGKLRVPRAWFVPSVVWVDDPVTDGFGALVRDDDPDRWHALVDSDEPVITQVDDGGTAQSESGVRPSSSCSQPSLVAAMLDALDVREGHRVLEIGCGTGWNAALLSERVGERGRVVSVEVDPAIAGAANRALTDAGYGPTVVTADGTSGYPAAAPYDRVICTASVRAIPCEWITQTRPGGVIVTPWGTDYGDDALTRLRVHGDGTTSGKCGRNLAFMRIRGQRREFVTPTADELAAATITRTGRTGRELYEMVTFARAAFTVGLRVPRCYLTVEDINRDERRIELHDVCTRSWARVTMLRGRDPWSVHQFGPRRLWDEADAAYTWWCAAGEPAPELYGLTVLTGGTHDVWLDEPHSPLRWPLSP